MMATPRDMGSKAQVSAERRKKRERMDSRAVVKEVYWRLGVTSVIESVREGHGASGSAEVSIAFGGAGRDWMNAPGNLKVRPGTGVAGLSANGAAGDVVSGGCLQEFGYGQIDTATISAERESVARDGRAGDARTKCACARSIEIGSRQYPEHEAGG